MVVNGMVLNFSFYLSFAESINGPSLVEKNKMKNTCKIVILKNKDVCDVLHTYQTFKAVQGLIKVNLGTENRCVISGVYRKNC